jgi:hypothetical protein
MECSSKSVITYWLTNKIQNLHNKCLIQDTHTHSTIDQTKELLHIEKKGQTLNTLSRVRDLRDLKDGVCIWWSILLDLYTSTSQSHYSIFFRLDTPVERFWLPTELNSRLNFTRLSLDYDSLHLIVASNCRAYNISARTTSKTPFQKPDVFTTPLPRGGPLLLVAYSLERVYRAAA